MIDLDINCDEVTSVTAEACLTIDVSLKGCSRDDILDQIGEDEVFDWLRNTTFDFEEHGLIEEE